jgi:hypothetical protein
MVLTLNLLVVITYHLFKKNGIQENQVLQKNVVCGFWSCHKFAHFKRVKSPFNKKWLHRTIDLVN